MTTSVMPASSSHPTPNLSTYSYTSQPSTITYSGSGSCSKKNGKIIRGSNFSKDGQNVPEWNPYFAYARCLSRNDFTSLETEEMQKRREEFKKELRERKRVKKTQLSPAKVQKPTTHHQNPSKSTTVHKKNSSNFEDSRAQTISLTRVIRSSSGSHHCDMHSSRSLEQLRIDPQSHNTPRVPLTSRIDSLGTKYSLRTLHESPRCHRDTHLATNALSINYGTIPICLAPNHGENAPMSSNLSSSRYESTSVQTDNTFLRPNHHSIGVQVYETQLVTNNGPEETALMALVANVVRESAIEVATEAETDRARMDDIAESRLQSSISRKQVKAHQAKDDQTEETQVDGKTNLKADYESTSVKT